MEWYSVLGLDPNKRKTITSNDIRKQYLKLAKIYHPDKGNYNNEAFIELHMAYENLSDEKKRYIYDNRLDTDSDETNIDDEDWWNILLSKYPLFKKIYESVEQFNDDLSKLKSWKADIILQIKISESSLNKIHQITYTRYSHKVVNSVVSFDRMQHRVEVYLPSDYNYAEDLFSIPQIGNDVIEGNKLICGDLNLDVVLM